MQTQTSPEPTNDGGRAGKRPLFEAAIVRQAIVDSFRKLDPRVQARNPVMFVVLVGSVFTTLIFLQDLSDARPEDNLFAGLVAAWLWFTVLFANFAEAMAEGRGKAQAAALRKTRAETIANRRRSDGSIEEVSSSGLTVNDVVVVSAGEMIPSDGEIIEGIASVDESAITGESAPVIREAGGDRSAVTGGTRVLSDQIVVRITARPGETFLDRMIALVEGANRQKTPNEIALNTLSAVLTIIFLLGNGDLAAVRHLLRCGAGGHRPGGSPRLSHPHHDRRPALGNRHRRHGPPGAAQRVGDVGPGGRGGRGLLDPPPGQDGDGHPGQSPGGGVPRPARDRGGTAGGGGPAGQSRRRDPGGPIDRGPRPRSATTSGSGTSPRPPWSRSRLRHG